MFKYTTEEEKMIEVLKKRITDNNAPKINQERFDEIIAHFIKEQKDELIWRLCVTYYKYNHHKAIDYYISNRDAYYLEELVSIISDDIDQEYVVEAMIKTGDKEFIKMTLNEAGNSIYYALDSKYLDKLIDFVK